MNDRYTLTDVLTGEHVEQVYDLIQQQWWGGRRSLEDVRIMIANTSLMVALIDNQTDHLVGFARVLTDFAFRATIYDVMVASHLQKTGLGRKLMDALCDHPKLQRVSFIYLACEPGLFSFYEQWGFREYEGKAEWMIKVQREE